eukprot:TRINITY_DN8_c0_g3_i1.p1 TRINITY_DN8_c0_g3~~TRINITY_DN8_c0_g3_i1.p1  ORF type:complete len:878 (+),score=239.79 TRINITY_DN8_c0_g3_i1:33-2666(+)
MFDGGGGDEFTAEPFEVNKGDIDHAMGQQQKRRKVSREKRKEDAALGMWATDDLGDEEAGEGEWGGRRQRGSDYSRPVSFVQRGVYTADSRTTRETGGEYDEEDGGQMAEEDEETAPPASRRQQKRDKAVWEVDRSALPTQLGGFGPKGRRGSAPRGGLGFGGSPANGGGDAGGGTDQTSYVKQYGIGSKLLFKMGWRPGEGVGKQGNQGIAEPIEVKVRPKNRGLAYEFSEMTDQMANYKKKIEKEHRQASTAEGEEAEAEATQTSLAEEDKLWKKGRRERKQKVRYHMEVDHEEAEEGSAHETTSQVIWDYTGPKAKLITTSAESGVAHGRSAAAQGVVAGPLPELQHNMRLLLEIAHSSLVSSERKISSERERTASLARERERLREAANYSAHRVDQLTELVAVLGRAAQRSAGGDLTLASLHKLFALLKDKYPDQYASLRLSSLALSLVSPAMARYLADWAPLQNPHFAVDLFAEWRSLLAETAAPTPEAELLESLRNEDSPDTSWTDADVFTKLVIDNVLPKVRACALSWNARNPEPLTALLTAWRPALPTMVSDHVACQLVLPRLLSEVERWDPRTDTVPVHAWLHPWLPVIGAPLLEPLWSPIRAKLATALGDWQPSDPSAHALLMPWKQVFDPLSMERLLVRCVVPKLALALRSLIIDPRRQALEPFNWAISWHDLVPERHMAALLEAEFFPKWRAVLLAWLGMPGLNYEEVSRWYLGWKSLFPAALTENPRVRLYLTHALDIINAALSGSPMPTPPPVTTAAAAAAAARLPAPTALAQAEDDDGMVSMRDVVEEFAAAHEVLLVPTARTHDGKQVMRFGTTSIVVDRSSVQVEVEGHAWRGIAMDDLLTLARVPQQRQQQDASGGGVD